MATEARAAATQLTGHDVADELRVAGLTPTAGRRLVLAVLRAREHPASAFELHRWLLDRGRPVGLTTVYRTLHALATAGLVHAFHRDGELTYRHCQDRPHQHLVCVECGLVAERPAEALAGWLEQVRREEDFVPDPSHSDLYGVCGPCARSQECGPPA